MLRGPAQGLKTSLQDVTRMSSRDTSDVIDVPSKREGQVLHLLLEDTVKSLALCNSEMVLPVPNGPCQSVDGNQSM